ncbi:MAG: serpin family protein [Bacteroidota bacterium]
MKKSIFPLSLFVCILCLFQCNEDLPGPNPGPAVDFDCNEEPKACELTSANGNFAIDLYKTISGNEADDANIFISPFSISTALSMTMNGANGETLSEMQDALRVAGVSLEELNEAYQILLDVLPQLDPETQLKIANSIWHQEDYPVRPEFLDVNQEFYSSEVVPVDFAQSGVIDDVNAWVAENTNDLITEALSELPAGVVMLLINAIYFQGSWQTQFDAENTVSAEFNTPNGPVQAELMHQPETNMRYFETERFQAVDLPYGDSIFSMSVFLPKEGFEVQDVVSELSAENWANWLTQFTSTNIELLLPKFEMEYEIKLKGTLPTMGMPTAFTDFADFSQMIQGGGVKIDDVIHKAFIEVDEEGTEAAAVTVVVVVETSAPQYPVFKADHPFFFVIHDNKTNSILFMGQLMNPE